MVDLSVRSGCPQCCSNDDPNKAFLVDLIKALFTAVHLSKGVGEKCLIVPRAEDYCVRVLCIEWG